MRPNTLNVCRDKTDNDTNKFIREALHAWRAKARCSVVPAERLRDLFEELHFSPTEKQINEMLQTAKLFARRGSSLEPNVSGSGKRVNGLTFGEFCVLAADLKRFRTTAQQQQQQPHQNHSHTHAHAPNATGNSSDAEPAGATTGASAGGSGWAQTHSGAPQQCTAALADKTEAAAAAAERENSPLSLSNGGDMGALTPAAPEVFLGGSCNPTTWRADVAIPALDKLGISFYNPQVSDWTPDLIELEHRAKEKARVLFFVMDSETRASAGAIEAAHIAGQNARHLVLVLHPYQPKQCILNEPISAQEFRDLKRNQVLLRELVSRRGLPVLDNIPSGLQRTRAILAGTSERPTPHNIAARLITVSRAYDLVATAAQAGRITIAQCQTALPVLGYAANLLSTDNLMHILRTHREAVAALGTAAAATTMKSEEVPATAVAAGDLVTFDEFCMLTSYLTVLQQEIHESGCVSPIKGTNLPPPPIYLTNQLEFTHTQQQPPRRPDISQIFRTSSCKSVPEDQRYHRDSGTSSPQPPPPPTAGAIVYGRPLEDAAAAANDSDDSVFSSSGSSTDSVVRIRPKPIVANSTTSAVEMRDIFLGGSCAQRSSWRHEVAVPLLRQRGISFHQPDDRAEGSDADGDGDSSRRAPNMMQRMAELLVGGEETTSSTAIYDPAVMDASRVLLFVITNETRSLAPMTLAAHYIGLGYNVVLSVQMLPEFCYIGSEKLTPAAIKDYNRGRSYLMDLAKRQGVPVFGELRAALDCAVEKVRTYNSRNSI